jgi:D-inositol-3-phosphate glycosyltransferase
VNPHLLLISLHADPASPSGAENAGGTHAYIRELLTGLASRGWEATMVTRRASADLPARERISRHTTINRIQIGPLGPLHKSHLDGLHAESVASTREVVLRGRRRPDLVHSVYWNSGRVALDLSGELGIPFVHTVISNGKRRTLMGAARNASRREEVEGWVFGAAFRIFCISQEERRDLVDLYSVDPARLVVVGRPVAECFLDPAHDEMGRPRPLRLARDAAGEAP